MSWADRIRKSPAVTNPTAASASASSSTDKTTRKASSTVVLATTDKEFEFTPESIETVNVAQFLGLPEEGSCADGADGEPTAVARAIDWNKNAVLALQIPSDVWVDVMLYSEPRAVLKLGMVCRRLRAIHAMTPVWKAQLSRYAHDVEVLHGCECYVPSLLPSSSSATKKPSTEQHPSNEGGDASSATASAERKRKVATPLPEEASPWAPATPRDQFISVLRSYGHDIRRELELREVPDNIKRLVSMHKAGRFNPTTRRVPVQSVTILQLNRKNKETEGAQSAANRSPAMDPANAAAILSPPPPSLSLDDDAAFPTISDDVVASSSGKSNKSKASSPATTHRRHQDPSIMDSASASASNDPLPTVQQRKPSPSPSTLVPPATQSKAMMKKIQVRRSLFGDSLPPAFLLGLFERMAAFGSGYVGSAGSAGNQREESEDYTVPTAEQTKSDANAEDEPTSKEADEKAEGTASAAVVASRSRGVHQGIEVIEELTATLPREDQHIANLLLHGLGADNGNLTNPSFLGLNIHLVELQRREAIDLLRNVTSSISSSSSSRLLLDLLMLFPTDCLETRYFAGPEVCNGRYAGVIAVDPIRVVLFRVPMEALMR